MAQYQKVTNATAAISDAASHGFEATHVKDLKSI
jgi:hypothetical protein